MRQVAQNYRSGELVVLDVPPARLQTEVLAGQPTRSSRRVPS